MEPVMKSTISMILALSLAACSSDVGGDPLTGTWGGMSFQVSATRESVTIALSCGAVVRVRHAIIPDASGRFTVRDSVRGSIDGGARDTLPGRPEPAVIGGQLSGDLLTINVALDRRPDVAPTRFAGRRGRANADTIVCRP
jgi:hypothetical protein